MEYLRNWLLQNGETQLYESILNYFSAPDRFDIQAIVDSAPENIRAHLQKQLDEAIRLFATEKTVYQANYTYGQIIVWNEVLKAYRILEQQKSIIEKAILSPDVSNYAVAMSEVKKILFPYSRMQIALSDLEETLGVDRFLDRVSEGTFLVLKSILDETKRIVEKKTEKHKAVFQSKDYCS